MGIDIEMEIYRNRDAHTYMGIHVVINVYTHTCTHIYMFVAFLET